MHALSLSRLVYFSRNLVSIQSDGASAELNDILAASAVNNSRQSITGALLYDENWFLQVLEGDRGAVSATFLRIASDKRHAEVTLCEVSSQSSRLFAQWSMAAGWVPSDSLIYRNHGYGERFDPSILDGQQAVLLAMDLVTRRK